MKTWDVQASAFQPRLVNPISSILINMEITLVELFKLRLVSTLFRQACEALIEDRLNHFNDRETDNCRFKFSANYYLSFKYLKLGGFAYRITTYHHRLECINMSLEELQFTLNVCIKRKNTQDFKKSMGIACRKQTWTKELIAAFADTFDYFVFIKHNGLVRSQFSWTLDEIKDIMNNTLGTYRCLFGSPHSIELFFDFHKSLFYEVVLLAGEKHAQKFFNYLLKHPEMARCSRFEEFVKTYETVWSPREWKEMKHFKSFMNPRYIRSQQRFGKIKWSLDEIDSGFKEV